MKRDISKATITIPFAYSGMKAEDVPNELLPKAEAEILVHSHDPLVVNDSHYTIQQGYLVPFYKPKAQDRKRTAEELVIDRAKRFFYTAEKELDIKLTRDEIVAATQEYQGTTDIELKRVRGRYLVGEMVNRMERLAKAMLQGNLHSVDLEIRPQSGTLELSEDEIAACKKEFVEYYMFLTNNPQNEPIRWMRLREDFAGQDTCDHDGILLDLVREMGKSISAPESNVRSGILQKIGHTMSAIDEVNQDLHALLSDTTLKRAFNEIGGSNNPKGSKLESYVGMLDELTLLCRARTGIKSDDATSFRPIRERTTLLMDRLEDMNKAIGKLSDKQGFGVTAKAQHLLRTGLGLIREMSATRLPRNKNAPEIYENERYPDRDNSSCGRFHYDVDKWLGRGARTRALE